MLPLLFILSVALTGVTEGTGVLPEGPLNATTGGSVIFNVTLTPPGTQIIIASWRFGDNEILTVRPPPFEDFIHPDYKDRITFFNSTGSLELRKLTVDDSGLYRVDISPESGPSLVGSTTLTVHAPVSNVRVEPAAADLVEFKDSLRLSCSSSGSSLTFSWMKGSSEVTAGDRVQITDGGATLTIVNVTRDDQGIYSCHVSNPVSNNISKGVNITVNSPVSNVRVEPAAADLVEFNSSLRLSCSSSGSSLTFCWMKGSSEVTAGDRVQITDGGATLTMVNVTRDDHGIYSCHVSNPVSSDKYEASVSVSYGPENVKVTASQTDPSYSVGSTISLTCSADSRPSAQFSWLWNGTELPNTGAELKLTNVNVNQSGNYSCEAFNSRTLRNQTSEPLKITVRVVPPVPPYSCSDDPGCIAGIVIAVIVVIAAAAGLGYYCMRKKKRTKSSTSTTTGGGAHASELNYADLKFYQKKNGETVQMGSQNTETNYAEVRVTNNRPAASSPPTYDVHMQRAKRPAPQPGADGVPVYAQVRKNQPQ